MPRTTSNQVRLSPEHRQFAQSLVAAGKFSKVEDVVASALNRELARQRDIHLLNQQIQLGLDSAAASGWIDGESVFREILGKGTRPVKGRGGRNR